MASGKGNVAMQNKRYKLRCKIKRGEAQGKDVSHFKNQLAELSRQSIHYEKIYSSKKERNLVNKQKSNPNPSPNHKTVIFVSIKTTYN